MPSTERYRYPSVHPNCRDLCGLMPITAKGIIFRGGNTSQDKLKKAGITITAELSFTSTTKKYSSTCKKMTESTFPVWYKWFTSSNLSTSLHPPIIDNYYTLELHSPADENQKEYSKEEAIYILIKKMIQWVNAGYKVYGHCDAGKDRTGMFFATLESLLGVAYNDIVYDCWDECKAAGHPVKGTINTVKGWIKDFAGNEGQQQEGAITKAIKHGISRSEIDKFIQIMTGGTLPPDLAAGAVADATTQAVSGFTGPTTYVIHDPNLPQWKENGEEGGMLKNALNNKNASGTLKVIDVDSSILKHTRIYRATEPTIVLAEMYIPLENRTIPTVPSIDASAGRGSMVNGQTDSSANTDSSSAVPKANPFTDTSVPIDTSEYLINQRPNYIAEFDEWVAKSPDTNYYKNHIKGEDLGNTIETLIDEFAEKYYVRHQVSDIKRKLYKIELQASETYTECRDTETQKNLYLVSQVYSVTVPPMPKVESPYLIDKNPNYMDEIEKAKADDPIHFTYIGPIEELGHDELGVKEQEALKQVAFLYQKEYNLKNEHFAKLFKVSRYKDTKQLACKNDVGKDMYVYLYQISEFSEIEDVFLLIEKDEKYHKAYKKWEEADPEKRVYVYLFDNEETCKIAMAAKIEELMTKLNKKREKDFYPPYVSYKVEDMMIEAAERDKNDNIMYVGRTMFEFSVVPQEEEPVKPEPPVDDEYLIDTDPDYDAKYKKWQG